MFDKDFQEIQEKKEAKEYFRQNNTEIARTKDIILALLIATIITIVGIVIIEKIIEMIRITSTLFYIAIGLVIAAAIKTVINKSTLPIKVMVGVGYFLGVVIGTVIVVYMVAPFSIEFSWALEIAIEYIFKTDLISTIFIAVGGFVAVAGIH